jgi:hypothetical protein
MAFEGMVVVLGFEHRAYPLEPHLQPSVFLIKANLLLK